MLYHQINTDILDEIGSKTTTAWAPFSKEEFKQALIKCNNSLAPSPDKLSWHYLKSILKQDVCFYNFINIADVYIHLGHWPNHFKRSSTMIIPKLNKMAYDHPKSFWPIVLLKDHEINLTEEAPKELNTKAYAMMIKEEETLNQWLNE